MDHFRTKLAGRGLSLSIAVTAAIMCCVFHSCRKSRMDEEPRRTVLVYMIADNNIYYNAVDNIIQMQKAWDYSFAGDLLVMLNDLSGRCTLYKIQKSKEGEEYNITSKILKEYPADSDPCNLDFMTKVINDAMTLCPADSYALDLWSHGTGWFPENQNPPLTTDIEQPLRKETSAYRDNGLSTQRTEKPGWQLDYFGYTYSFDSVVEINDLAKALKPFHFDFILFDACFMGSIECMYELKDVCEYYISSTAEIKTYGWPYDRILSYMFEPKANVTEIAKQYYDYYNEKAYSYDRSATVSVVESSKLSAVAGELKKIVTKNPYIPFSTIQQYGRTGYKDCFFDLEDFVQKTWGEETSTAFRKAMADAVTYKAATPMLFDEIQIIHHCGASCYIPVSWQPKCNSSFRTYSWAMASGLGSMLD